MLLHVLTVKMLQILAFHALLGNICTIVPVYRSVLVLIMPLMVNAFNVRHLAALVIAQVYVIHVLLDFF